MTPISTQNERKRSIEQIAELVVDGTLKVHLALEPGLLESTYWLPREWRPPWDQRRREAHGQSVLNGFVVFLGAPGVFAVNPLSALHTARDKRLWFEPGNPPAPRREQLRNSLHVITFRQSPMA